jgi:heme A synthase
MAESKSWAEMSNRQRAGIATLGLIQMALLFAALRDMRHRSEESINGSKRFWRAAVFINFIGPIAYFWKGRRAS